MKQYTKYVAIILGLIAVLTFGIYFLNASSLGTNRTLLLLSGAFFTALAILVAFGNILPLAERLYQPLKEKRNLDDALREYLEWVNNAYGRLDLRGVEERESRPHNLSLDDVYVSLTVAVEREDDTKHRRQEEQEPRTIDMRDLLREGRHIAITGGPGSGKTTYLRIIAASLAQAHLENNPVSIRKHLGVSEPLPIPIFISLGEYNRYRRKFSSADDPEKGTIRGYINYLAQKREGKTPAHFLNRLLDSQRPIMVLLDGLDEVANEKERRLVTTEVQHFVDSNPDAIIFVTSRTRAYHGQARLADFRVAAVQSMTPEQVAELVRRWCDAVYATEEEREKERKALLAELEALEAKRKARNEPRLIDTPLMVTVVAIVHYNEHKLPEQRAELYKKCVDILLAEKHHPADEATEELRDWGGTETDKRQFLALLAFKMMGAGEKAGRQVAEEQIKAWLEPAFIEEYGEVKAREHLQEFLAAVRERGSLLQERDSQYSFVHLTFQEFLCAYYLAETMRETDRIIDYLIEDDRVTQSWWRETVLLTLGYIGLGSKPTALKLVERLALAEGSDELQLASAELAATAFLELESRAEKLHKMLHDRLVVLLTTPGKQVQPSTRLLAGDALGRLGDERPGVCTLEPDMILIDSGLSFPMGDEKIETTLKQPFAMARYPVTNAQFRHFVEGGGYANPDYWELAIAAGRWKDGKYIDHEFLGGVHKDRPAYWDDPVFSFPNQPVVGVSWYEAMAYVAWLRGRKVTKGKSHYPVRYRGLRRCPDGQGISWCHPGRR
jgi:nicotinamide riboside kinase